MYIPTEVPLPDYTFINIKKKKNLLKNYTYKVQWG